MASEVLEFSGSAQYDDNGVKRYTRIVPRDLWGYYFLNLASHDHPDKTVDEKTEKEFEDLKEQVRNMIRSSSSMNEKLVLIDDVQRLGLGYHFESEIEDALENIFNDDNYDQDNLFTVSLRFRLLRQQGHHVSSDVFKRFLDEQGKFKDSLADDVAGLLSLYEASYLAIHGETILDEAQAFTTTHLHSIADAHPMADQIHRALNQSIRRNIPILETIYCIDLFSKDDSKNQNLLKMAKLEFNMLQIQFLKELQSLTEWWKKVDAKTNFPYARDRLVETFFWSLAITPEPHYAFSRRIITKMTTILTVTDDTYDAYATYEELQPFTEAVQRWDINSIDHLPKYMKHIFRTYYDSMEEAKQLLEQQGRSDCLDYSVNQLKKALRAYLVEATWLKEGYFPTLEEYIENGYVSTCYTVIISLGILGLGNIATEEAMEWSSDHNNYPDIVIASAVICRLMDDIVTHELERDRPHIPSSVECCMKQYGVSKQEAVQMLEKKVSDAWKDTNQAFLKPTAVPPAILNVALNSSRTMAVLYKDCDGYTHSDVIKSVVDSVFLKPFSL